MFLFRVTRLSVYAVCLARKYFDTNSEKFKKRVSVARAGAAMHVGVGGQGECIDDGGKNKKDIDF